MDAELNWRVESVPILIKGKPTAYYDLVRKDNGHVLGNCTIKYEIKQNDEFIQETLMHAKLNGFNVTSYKSGTVDKEGKQVFVRIQTGQSFQIGKDTIDESITVVHHHDGRPVSNQSFCTYNIAGSHTINLSMVASKNLSDVACLKCSKEIIDALRRMSKTPITVGDTQSIINQLINPNKMPMSPRRIALKEKLEHSIIDMVPSTVWDVFKGIISYSELIKTSKDRKASMFIGSSAKMVESAFHLLSKHTKANWPSLAKK
jgi:hypothetical protein